MGGATAEEAAEAAERRYAAITREPPAETSPNCLFHWLGYYSQSVLLLVIAGFVG